jgi:hypothetical protein
MTTLPEMLAVLGFEKEGDSCPRCGYYKRGEDGCCVSCGSDWSKPERHPVEKTIERLRELRMEVAARNEDLHKRELDSRVLRNRLEDEYRRGEKPVVCTSKEAAEKAAKIDPDYLQFELTTGRLVRERDIVLAAAETSFFALQAHIAGALTLDQLRVATAAR